MSDFDECDKAETKAKAFTTSSDLVDKAGRKAAEDRGEKIGPNDYLLETEYAYTMQLCKSWLKILSQNDWPQVDEARVETIIADTEEIKKNKMLPVDALLTLGTTVLHEVSTSTKLWNIY